MKRPRSAKDLLKILRRISSGIKKNCGTIIEFAGRLKRKIARETDLWYYGFISIVLEIVPTILIVNDNPP